MPTIGAQRLKALLLNAFYPQLLHQSQRPVSAACETFFLEMMVDRSMAVSSVTEDSNRRTPPTSKSAIWYRMQVGFLAILPGFLYLGCTDPDGASTDHVHEEFSHEHVHQHTADDDHEHDHGDGFRGTHSHNHGHHHRHGEQRHGGHIVSIGDTHEKDAAAHFYAEVMPLKGNMILFYLLTESDTGESREYSIDSNEIPALVSVKGRDSVAVEDSFKPIGDAEKVSEFGLAIPGPHAEAEAFLIVVPKIVLGGSPQNFSFSISRVDSNGENESSEHVTRERSEELITTND